jgi:hypothetical protein
MRKYLFKNIRLVTILLTQQKVGLATTPTLELVSILTYPLPHPNTPYEKHGTSISRLFYSLSDKCDLFAGNYSAFFLSLHHLLRISEPYNSIYGEHLIVNGNCSFYKSCTRFLKPGKIYVKVPHFLQASRVHDNQVLACHCSSM